MLSVSVDECFGFLCGDGKCLPSSGRCNMLGECTNSEDEANCTCADFLKAQLLHQKICDGVADCWDYSDETDCGMCSGFFSTLLVTKVCLFYIQGVSKLKDNPEHAVS